MLLLGASGTLGQATAAALVARGHAVVALLRPGSGQGLPAAVLRRYGHVTEPMAVAQLGLRGERFDAVLSCLASRSGVPSEAWAVDHLAHRYALQAALAAQVPRFVQLSALCLQRPRLAFQHAKLAFEAELRASPLDWRIVRPTAFFKSLSGQLQRLRSGKPFLMFGDGRLTACKPISDADLAHYLVDTLQDPGRACQVLPIGGPGPAITPIEQGELLFAALGRTPHFRSVPTRLLSGLAAVLGTAGRFVPSLAAKSELARIGHYYATESMLVWDETRQCYDAAATPSTGSDTLAAHYARLARGELRSGLGAHALFGGG
ncbi:MAG: NAD(P)H-binding protein [Ideonella sp.]|nr:NAD(P)H-binding protein [Ideonella sp.]